MGLLSNDEAVALSDHWLPCPPAKGPSLSAMKRLLAVGLLAISAQARADGVSKKTATTAAYCAGVKWALLLQTPDRPEPMRARVQDANDLMQAGIEQAIITQHQAQLAYDRGTRDAQACKTDANGAVCQTVLRRCP